MVFLVYSPKNMTWPLSDEQKGKLATLEEEYNAKIISCRPTTPGSHYSAHVEVIFKDSLMKDAHRTLDFVGLMRVSNFKVAVRKVLIGGAVSVEKDHEE